MLREDEPGVDAHEVSVRRASLRRRPIVAIRTLIAQHSKRVTDARISPKKITSWSPESKRVTAGLTISTRATNRLIQSYLFTCWSTRWHMPTLWT